MLVALPTSRRWFQQRSVILTVQHTALPTCDDVYAQSISALRSSEQVGCVQGTDCATGHESAQQRSQHDGLRHTPPLHGSIEVVVSHTRCSLSAVCSRPQLNCKNPGIPSH